MIFYLLMGILVSWFMDWLTFNTPYQLSNWERFLMVLIWPLMFIFIAWEFIKDFIKNE